MITNRNTGYRWILRRDDHRVEFQTPQMLEEAVAEESIEVHLSIEEAEALARAAQTDAIKDKRTKALFEQALDQIVDLSILRTLCDLHRIRRNILSNVLGMSFNPGHWALVRRPSTRT